MWKYIPMRRPRCMSFSYVSTDDTLTGRYLPWLEPSTRLAKDSSRWSISLSNTRYMVDHLKSITQPCSLLGKPEFYRSHRSLLPPITSARMRQEVSLNFHDADLELFVYRQYYHRHPSILPAFIHTSSRRSQDSRCRTLLRSMAPWTYSI